MSKIPIYSEKPCKARLHRACAGGEIRDARSAIAHTGSG